VKILALVAALLLATGCSTVLDLGDAAAAQPAVLDQVPDYDRDRFGDGWADVDSDCQDTRQEILQRDLVDVTLTGDGCDVATGTLNDPYTGTTIAFRRGQTTSDDVQIDHVLSVPAAVLAV
jgi:hypothetical protein